MTLIKDDIAASGEPMAQSRASGQPAFGGALEGLRVVDLSRVLAGPYASMILADHGADVIKIEPPDGDETRKWGPPFDENSGGASYFVGVNRNKRAVTMNLKDQGPRETLLELLADADVVMENFKPGTMEAWGLGYEDLSERFPGLIYCRITGFGEEGPYGGLAGYDAILQAMSGLMSVNGSPETGATKLGCPVVDLSTGLYSVIGILMALHERQRSGLGQFIDMTLFDCSLAVLHPHAANYLLNGKVPGPLGNSHPNLAPCEKFTTRTGDIFIAIGNDGQFRKLTEVLGCPELAGDARFAKNSGRIRNMGRLFDELRSYLADMDGEDVCRQLLQLAVPAGPVLTVDQALSAEQTQARGMLLDDAGYRGIASPIKFSRTRARLQRPPPRQSQDQEILKCPKSVWVSTGES